jgi:uncharacterized protein (UPF0332 family)
MSFDWSTYIDLARNLNALPEHEQAAQRSAVSRAYYAVFHEASGTLKTNCINTYPKDQRKSHDKVWNVYKGSSKRDCRRIGNKAARLMEDRHDADYDAARVFNLGEVATFITDVESLVTAIRVPLNLPEGSVGPFPAPVVPAWLRVITAVKRTLGW